MGFILVARNALCSPLFIAVIFFWMIQIPYIVNGGLIVDDWGDISVAFGGKGFWSSYNSFFGMFSNRPMAVAPLALVTNLYMLHDWAYRLTHAIVWFAGAVVFASVLARRFGKMPAAVYIAFAAMPVISPAFAFSPINMLVASVAFLFWALSCFCLDQHLLTGRKDYYWLSYLLVLAGLFTYEIILPLLVWNALYPALFNNVGEAVSTTGGSISEEDFTTLLRSARSLSYGGQANGKMGKSREEAFTTYLH